MSISATSNVANDRVWNPTSMTSSGDAPSVMPQPQSLDSIASDPMSMIYALMSKQRNNDMESGKTDVTHKQQLKKAQLVEQEQALKKQEEAADNAKTWGIFGKIASVVAIALSAVLSVCSCGAASGLCAAACIISTMAFAEGQAQVLTKLTGNPDADKAFQIGSGIAAAICSGGAGIANLATATVQTAASVMGDATQIASAGCTIGQQALSAVDDKGVQNVAMALGIASAACALAGSASGLGGAVSSAASSVEKIVSASVAVANGAVEIGSGVATIVSSQYSADATDRAADAKHAQLRIAELAQLTSWVIDGIKDTDKSHERALQTLSGAIQTKAQTLVIASARV